MNSSRSLLIDLDEHDAVVLSDLARATGQPRAVVARALMKAALAAEALDIDAHLPLRPTDPEEAA